VLAGPAQIKEVEKTNTVMVCPNQRAEFVQCNWYAIDVDRGGIVIVVENLVI